MNKRNNVKRIGKRVPHSGAYVALLVVIFIMIGCSDQPPTDIAKSFSSSSPTGDSTMYDPDMATLVGFTNTVSLELLDGSGSIQVPTFNIRKKSSTFVRVLRCKSDYNLKSSIGVPFESLDEITKYQDMKWIWNKASGDYANCKYVGTHVHRNKIQDFAADSGSYFYLINPCVSKKRSLSGKEDCSNDLHKTNVISYDSTLKEAFVKAAQQLSEMEIEVGSVTDSIKSLAELIMYEQAACEKVAAIKASNVGFFRGIASLAGAVVGGVVGSMFGGPVGAMQGATSFMGIARDLVNKYGPKVKLDCSGADKYRESLALEVDRLEKAVEQVIVLRNNMAAINNDYRKLNDLVESETYSE